MTFLTEALFHAHPDIYVLYDNSFINAEMNEILANKFADLVPKTLNRLWTNAQRAALKEFYQDPNKPMTCLTRVSDTIKAEMKQEYISNLPGEKLVAMVSPEQINKLKLNLPPHFTRLVAVLKTINDMINRCIGHMPEDEIAHLKTYRQMPLALVYGRVRYNKNVNFLKVSLSIAWIDALAFHIRVYRCLHLRALLKKQPKHRS